MFQHALGELVPYLKGHVPEGRQFTCDRRDRAIGLLLSEFDSVMPAFPAEQDQFLQPRDIPGPKPAIGKV